MRKRDKLKNYQQANLMLEQSYLKSKGLINEELLNEVEDLELKKTAKELFLVAKKYNLQPRYETKAVKYDSKEAGKGYGAEINVNNGIITVAIYDRGVLQGIRRGNFPGVESKEVSDTSNDPSDDSNKKGLGKALGILFKEFMAKFPQDKFETRSENQPNEYGFYFIQARPKQQQKK